ncbi:MAG: YbaK/EbsC family protein [Alphaproteobacteria bacterium]
MHLSKSAQTVQATLHGKGLDFQVVELAASTRTAVDAANAIGCTVAQIGKSVIFKTANTNRPVRVIASGPSRVSEKIIADHAGEKIEKADADFIREVTGFAIGGVSPVGHAQPIELVFIDEDLLAFEELWAAAGTSNAVFKLRGEDLQKLTHGCIVKVKD